jgi:hypothetical protein
MKVTIDVSSEEAEIILYSLALRSRQPVSRSHQNQAALLAIQLEKCFVAVFHWTPGVFKAKWMRLKRVTVKGYDVKPEFPF